MGKRVFVSYARTDAARVTAECDTLGAAGFSLWRDDRIEVGTDWRDEIAAAIERCDALLYFVSPASAQSDVCINEIDLALQLRKPVYALHIEPTVLPTRLSFRVGGRQAILAHLLEPSVYRARLIAAIGGERTDESTGFDMPRIAVVPFESIDPDSPHGWLGRRLAISISSLLHRSGRFDVVPERDLR